MVDVPPLLFLWVLGQEHGGGLSAFGECAALWFGVSPSPTHQVVLMAVSHRVVQGLAGARRSVIGDSPQLLTHYYDDARTMYEVFRRGFSISGESMVGRGGGPGDVGAQIMEEAQRLREA